ncbi:MAG: hypothetical protein NVSMB26_00190 [Beijerinckiaceae bacterium]
MSETRSEGRAGCLVHGRILASGLAEGLDCTIWDISEQGARLMVADSAIVPNKIQIKTPFSAVPRRAEVRWRKPGEVGIKLLDETISRGEAELSG